MAKQTNDILTAVAIGNDGALQVLWAVGTGSWNGPAPISPKGMFQPGAGVAMINFNGVLEGFANGKDGGIYTSWISRTGPWNGPVKIS